MQVIRDVGTDHVKLLFLRWHVRNRVTSCTSLAGLFLLPAVLAMPNRASMAKIGLFSHDCRPSCLYVFKVIYLYLVDKQCPLNFVHNPQGI